MKGYKKILVAVDLSDDSAFVVEKATQIGRHYQAEISLMHVMEPLAVTYGIDASGGYFQEMYAEIMRKCRDSLRELGKSAGIPEFRLHNVLGSPAREIRRFATDIYADLVVVGGHGKHGLDLLLGATSSSVSHGIDCDLLIVRLPSK